MYFKKTKKMNKKGAVPLGETILIVWSTVPTPIKMALFILLITFFSSIAIPFILKLVGFECAYDRTGEINLYQIPPRNLLRNVISETNTIISRFVIGVDEYRFPDDPHPDGNKSLLRIKEECIIDTEINGTPTKGYTAMCSNCSFAPQLLWGLFGATDDSICLGNGFYEPSFSRFGRNIFAEGYCKQCSPPSVSGLGTEYYFNINNCPNPPYECYFTLLNSSVADQVIDIARTDYYEKIVSLGGVRQPIDTNEAFNLQCLGEGIPSLFFFQVEIFNRGMWIIIIISSFLVPFFWSYYNQVL